VLASRGCGLLGALVALALALAGPAHAAGDPDLHLTGGPATSVLYGHDVPVSLTASLPAGSSKGYNLAYYVLLPDGAHYAGTTGSDGAPREVVLTGGRTALQWDDVADLVANSSHTLSFSIEYNSAPNGTEHVFEVAETLPVEASAYVSLNHRAETDWDTLSSSPTYGEAVGPDTVIPYENTYTGWADKDGATTLSAIEVTKSEPSPENELPRGLHDQQTPYTLTVRNNSVRATTDVALEDWIPAGLEFLGCLGTTDNTTDAPTNLGFTEEYVGSGPIVVDDPGPDCDFPDLVETLWTDPDGILGPLPLGVYTHIMWTALGTYAIDEVQRFTYMAAIPIRENTTWWPATWPGGMPNTIGEQAANLDNNSGPETYDEQPLLNGAIVTGTSTPPFMLPKSVSHAGTLLVSAEDLAIQKSKDKHGLEAGELTRWTIDLQVSEYRSVDDVTITDIVPDGLCPVGPANYEAPPDEPVLECFPSDPNDRPGPTEEPAGTPAPYKQADEQPDGTYKVVWDKGLVPSLAHVEPNDTRRIAFSTITREYYQQDYDIEEGRPILSRDTVLNAVDVSGKGWVRCTSDPEDCATAAGTKIWDDEDDGTLDFDLSGSGKAAGGVTIDKQVAATYPSGGCASPSANYVDSVPEYGPGDKVCWKLRLDFPHKVHTNSQRLFDHLPTGVTLDGTPQTITNTAGTPVVLMSTSPLEWTLGTASGLNDIVSLGPGVIEIVFQTTTGSPLGHHSGDVEGNLMKFSYANSAGRAFALRDRADFKLKIPELSLRKSVLRVRRNDQVFPPNTDHVAVAGGDLVTYGVEVTNGGAADASSSTIWDKLPLGTTCADVSAISNGGMCIANRIEWTSIPVAALSTVTLTYMLTIPADVSPCVSYVNTAGVVEATYLTNDGVPYQLIPDNSVIRDPTLPGPNMPAAQDVSDVYLPCATVVKRATTSVTESGNDEAQQAAIGETIHYTVRITIPHGTTMYGVPTVVDDLGTRLDFVDGTLSATLDGSAVLPVGMTVVEAGNVITTTFPSPYVNPNGTDDVLVLTFDATVLDVAANVRGADLPNTATLSYVDQVDVPRTADDTAHTTIVEPDVALDKSHAPSGTISLGQTVDFTITASNQTGTHVSTAHDAVVVDTLPDGMLPVFNIDGTVGPQNGIWDGNLRTITWNATTTPALASIAPGGAVDLTYEVEIGPAPVAGNGYTNAAHLAVASLDRSIAGVRTPASTSATAPDYAADVTDVLEVGLPSLTKEVAPDKVTIGDKVTWTVTVTLPSGVQYFDTTVTDLIPSGFELDNYGSITCPACPTTDLTVTPLGAPMGSGPLQVAWFLGDVPSSSSTRVYELKLHGHLRDTYANGAKVKDGQSLTNAASIHTNVTNKVIGTPTAVPGSFDDTVGPATATNHVVEPKLTIVKSADEGPFVEGEDEITYTIEITNTGTSPAYDVVVEDRPDAELDNVTLALGDLYNVDDWLTGGPDMRWVIPGPIAPGDTVTLTYTAHVKPAGVVHAGDQITNTAAIAEYFGVPETTRNLNPFVYRPYTGPQSTVTLTVAVPRLTIEKTPDDCMVTAGAQVSFTIKVTNTDTNATAHNVVVSDVLDAGLSYTAGTATAAPSTGFTGFSETSAVGQTIEFLIASIAPGGHVTITVPVTVGAGVADGTVLENIATTHADEVPTEQSDSGSLVVEATADLRVTKVSQPGPVVPGTDVEYTIVVTNDGPADTLDSKLTDTLPSYLSLVSIDDTTHCVVSGQLIACDFGTLAAGDTRTIHVTAKLDPARTAPIKNVAEVTTTTAETHDANNRAKATNEVKPTSDVSLHKTAAGTLFDAGATVTYTLVAHNDGPSVAHDVKIDDAVPAGLTFVSVTPGPTTCTYFAGNVHCDLGALAPGADRTVTVVTTANAVAAASNATSGVHAITVGKVQDTSALAPGATTTADLTCPANGSAVDGSVHVLSAGSLAAVHVERARSIARDSYRFTVTNGSSATAQIRRVVTCLPRETDPDTHAHQLEVGALQTLATGPLAPGRHVFAIPTSAGHHAVAPGIEVDSGRARLVRSEPDGTGRKLTIEVLATANVKLSIRALADDTAAAGVPTHVHALELTHVVRNASQGPGQLEHLVQCPAGYAGVVASYDLPEGVVGLGHEPLAGGRVFWLLNATMQVRHAKLDLECIGVQTGRSVWVLPLVNTATASTTSVDPIGANDGDSVEIGVRRPASTGGVGGGPHDGPAPQSTLGPPAVAIAGPTTTPVVASHRLRYGTLTFSRTAAVATLTLTCRRRTTCSGRLALTAPTPASPRSAAAGRLKSITLGKATYRVRAGKTTTVRVAIVKRHRSLLRSRRVRTVSIVSGTTTVTRKVVFARG